MRMTITGAILVGALLADGGARAQQVPASTLEEWRLRSINRSIEQQQREMQEKNQRVFDSNRRRGPLIRPVPGGPRRPGCPAGAIGC